MVKVKLGKYQHFKGNFYKVLGTAHHSENLEEFVIYQALYNHKKFGKKSLWIRPVKMFLEKVKHDGKMMPRFKYVG